MLSMLFVPEPLHSFESYFNNLVRPTAAMLLSHKAGSAASECVFRDTSSILTKYRHSTHDELVETYTVLRSLITDPSFKFEIFIKELQEFLALKEEIAQDCLTLLEDDKK